MDFWVQIPKALTCAIYLKSWDAKQLIKRHQWQRAAKVSQPTQKYQQVLSVSYLQLLDSWLLSKGPYQRALCQRARESQTRKPTQKENLVNYLNVPHLERIGRRQPKAQYRKPSQIHSMGGPVAMEVKFPSWEVWALQVGTLLMWNSKVWSGLNTLFWGGSFLTTWALLTRWMTRVGGFNSFNSSIVYSPRAPGYQVLE